MRICRLCQIISKNVESNSVNLFRWRPATWCLRHHSQTGVAAAGGDRGHQRVDAVDARGHRLPLVQPAELVPVRAGSAAGAGQHLAAAPLGQAEAPGAAVPVHAGAGVPRLQRAGHQPVADVIPSSVTIWQIASPPQSLGFTLVGALLIIPMILVYTAWAYYVFRSKVSYGEGITDVAQPVVETAGLADRDLVGQRGGAGAGRLADAPADARAGLSN